MVGNIVAIIQARTGSTRLPKKVLRQIQGKTVLEHVVERVWQSRLVDRVIVATTVLKSDQKIVEICNKRKIPVFRGDVTDVLDRYYQAARVFRANHVVRITSDCPLIDAQIIDRVISKHLSTHADYTANILHPKYPDGLDTEIFTFAALRKAWREAKLMSEREHVTPFMINHPQLFRQAEVRGKHDFSAKRWTLDYGEDFKFIKKIYDALYKRRRNFSMRDILNCLSEHKSWEKINRRRKRNLGYQKSLKNDKIIR